MTVRVRDGKKLAHEGIKVEFVGSIGVCMVLSCFERRALSPPWQSSSTTAGTTMSSCPYHKN